MKSWSALPHLRAFLILKIYHFQTMRRYYACVSFMQNIGDELGYDPEYLDWRIIKIPPGAVGHHVDFNTNCTHVVDEYVVVKEE